MKKNNAKKIVKILLCSITIFMFSFITISSSAAYIGDLNGDGVLTASEARYALRISNGLENSSTATVRALADVDGDGKVTAADARSILRASARVQDSVFSWSHDGDFTFFYTGTARIKVAVSENFPSGDLQGWASSCVADWNTSSLPCTYISGSGESGADIYIIGGTPKYILDTYGDVLMVKKGDKTYEVAHGMSSSPTYSTVDTITINGYSREIGKRTNAFDPTRIYIADKRSGGSVVHNNQTVRYDPWSDTAHANTVRHEIGHSLGYYGHTSSPGDLMYPNKVGTDSTKTDVSANHRAQITQFKNAYNVGALPSSVPAPLSAALASPNILSQSLPSLTDSSSNDLHKMNTRDVSTKNEKLDYMLTWFGFNDNIIIGKPVEISYGNKDAGISQNDCEIIAVEYKFQITDNLSGNELPEYITVRSQLGNIFEIGNEYCISPLHVNNTLWDKHIIYTFDQFMKADLITKKEVASLSSGAAEKAKEFTTQKPVTEKASLATDFISDVSLAVEITVTEKYKEESADNIVDVNYKINNIVSGKEYEHLLPELLRLNSDVEVGGTYMILLNVIDDSYVLPAARSGAVIKKNSSSFKEYTNAFSSLNQQLTEQ